MSLLNQSRDTITTQLVDLERENERLKLQIDKAEVLRQELNSLDEKYNTLLEMLGEKEERIMELEQDIVDMREAFKATLTNINNPSKRIENDSHNNSSVD